MPPPVCAHMEREREREGGKEEAKQEGRMKEQGRVLEGFHASIVFGRGKGRLVPNIASR